jgi:hypothetical protein
MKTDITKKIDMYLTEERLDEGFLEAAKRLRINIKEFFAEDEGRILTLTNVSTAALFVAAHQAMLAAGFQTGGEEMEMFANITGFAIAGSFLSAAVMTPESVFNVVSIVKRIINAAKGRNPDMELTNLMKEVSKTVKDLERKHEDPKKIKALLQPKIDRIQDIIKNGTPDKLRTEYMSFSDWLSFDREHYATHPERWSDDDL